MDWIRGKLAVFESKSARKLLIISAALTLVIILITLAGTFLTSMNNEISLLQGHVNSIPPLMQERLEELQNVYKSYTDDYIARGDIATTLYDNYGELTQQERLELARRHADALNVTLLDGSGSFIASATGAKPSLAVRAAYKAIDDDPAPLFDATMSDINVDQMEDGDDFDPETDSLPMVYDGHATDGSILMVEFDYTPFGQVIAERWTEDDIFKRALGGTNGYGFLYNADGEVEGYPLKDLSDAQREQIKKEVKGAFASLIEDFGGTISTDDSTTSFDFFSLLGRPHLAVCTTPDEIGYRYMIAVPMTSFAGFMFLCAVAIIALVVVGYVLFSRYAAKTFRENPIEAQDRGARLKSALGRTFAGIAVMLAVTAILSGMLLMLEGLSNTAQSTIAQHEVINNESAYNIKRKSDSEEEYTARYRARATAIARLLTDHPELRTLESLRALNKVVQSTHLMLFSQDGKEIFDSAGFTGFDVYDEETGGRSEWRAVLQGYIQVETPTTVNPITGQSERTIATHITDEQGLPDGFLLMVVNDDELVAEIGDATLEGAVNSFAPLEGQMAAVVDNETGLFLAHTDPDMIGEVASNYLDEKVIGHNFNGFTKYTGNSADVYVSGVSSEGKTTLVITDSNGNDKNKLISWIMIGVTLLLIFLVYYPTATSLCAKYVLECPVDENPDDSEDHPMMVFYHGYVAYLFALAVISLLGVVLGFWRAFEAVWGEGWTPGTHLFSIWMALFTFAGFSYIMTGLHRVIRHIDEHSNARTKTYARLTDSLVTYVMSILMIILILTKLGIDTKTISSIGIFSIAIGMGAQDLVKDIVAGLFLTYEGVIKVGDLVQIAGWYGRVTDMGIRTTKVSWHGESKIFNNSSVRDFLNGDGDPARMVLAMPISYDADLDEIEAILAEELPLMEHKIPGLVKPPQYENIDSLGESSVNLCIAIYVDYEKRNPALRSLAREIKAMCDRRGIEIPFNQLVLHNADLANGDADAQFSPQAPQTPRRDGSANEVDTPKADQR